LSAIHQVSGLSYAQFRAPIAGKNGSIGTSTTAKIKTSDDTSAGTIGRARMMAPIAIGDAADRDAGCK
jgi:hypothetical protein